MKRALVFVPWLIAVLACNLSVNPTPVIPATATAAPLPTDTPVPASAVPATGTITGKLSFPSQFLPAMRVVAFSLTDGKAYFIDTAEGAPAYSITVPPGSYYVVAYEHQGNPGATGQVDSYTLGGDSLAGGYTQMVPCGLTAECTDHSLLEVEVAAGQTVTVDPGDWYAPPGTFPSMPNP